MSNYVSKSVVKRLAIQADGRAKAPKQACVSAVYLWLDTLTPEQLAYLCFMVGGLECATICALAGVEVANVSYR